MQLPCSLLISTDQLFELLGNDNLRIIDASWYLPNSERNALNEFNDQHIAGAVFFALDKIADNETELPHMAASAESFAQAVGEMGISEKHNIVIYDVKGLFSAARVWWNFSIMGAKNIFVLDGGLSKWIADGYQVTDRIANHEQEIFVTKENPKLIKSSKSIYSAKDILQLISDDFANDEQIVDMRPNQRFLGKVAEPREGLRSGHIPKSKSLPFSELVKDGRLISEEELKVLFSQKNIDLSKPIISTCGSGVTAPILNLALATLGIDNLSVYDGSWAEWGEGNKYPVT